MCFGPFKGREEKTRSIGAAESSIIETKDPAQAVKDYAKQGGLEGDDYRQFRKDNPLEDKAAAERALNLKPGGSRRASFLTQPYTGTSKKTFLGG